MGFFNVLLLRWRLAKRTKLKKLLFLMKKKERLSTGLQSAVTESDFKRWETPSVDLLCSFCGQFPAWEGRRVERIYFT